MGAKSIIFDEQYFLNMSKAVINYKNSEGRALPEYCTPADTSESERVNKMINFFKKSNPDYYPVTRDQAQLIKAYFNLLHYLDAGFTYTFNEDFTKIRKAVSCI